MFTNRLVNLGIVAASIILAACAPGVAPTSTSPTATSAPTLAAAPVLEPTPEAEVWSTGLPPNGVWQVELTTDDLERMGVHSTEAPDWNGVYTFTYQNGKAFLERRDPGLLYHCEADQEIVGDVVRETYIVSRPLEFCIDVVVEFRWRLEEDGLHFRLVSVKAAPPVNIAAVLEAKPWQKIADQ